MKIISKSPDYYDWVAGFVPDNGLIYDRRDSHDIRSVLTVVTQGDCIHVLLNGRVYPMIYLQGKFQCSKAAFRECLKTRSLYLGEGLHLTSEEAGARYFDQMFSSLTNDNDANEEPVLVRTFPWNRLYKPKNLATLNFDEVLPSRNIFFEINDFLERNAESCEDFRQRNSAYFG